MKLRAIPPLRNGRKDVAWKVEIGSVAEKLIEKLGGDIENRIYNYLDTRIEGCKNPRRFGKNLSGNLRAYWCYRVYGDYRVFCLLDDENETVLVDWAGHRREAYDE
jgi:mRNA interferase RelE/StbE